ncbi:MAG: DUF305 domain-containing protein [Candidatus Microsaccharimonas sp.]
MNNKKLFIIIVVVLVLAVVASALYYGLRGNMSQSNTDSMSGMDMSGSTVNNSFIDTGSDTYKQYAAMSGEMYDRTFIANMVIHHQGAVDMARMALTNAKHQELKDMANDIISAQEKEIAEMSSWYKEWGYPSSDMDDSAMGVMNNMAGMTTELEGKTGDEFDKAFIEQMIMHHQSAINMAAPGEKNAQRQEVKDLTKAIVSAQTKEIEQLKKWQQEWGYDN